MNSLNGSTSDNNPSLLLGNPRLMSLLRCPVCGGPLARQGEVLTCDADAERRTEAHRFPVAFGCPVLIDESRSVYAIEDFTGRRDTFFALDLPWWRRLGRALIPKIGVNIHAARNIRGFARRLNREGGTPLVLVIGGSVLGEGMHILAADATVQLIESDVSFGPRTQLIADSHVLPFADDSLDGIVVQAVLEHVLDPLQCVREIRRVLRPGGLVYAEIPFMQPVHGGRYDFTRYTDLGLRRLFRHFNHIDSGATCGTGMALAWSAQYFLASFARGTAARRVLSAIAAYLTFYLKYFDRWLIDRAGTLDGASGLFFLGAKSGSEIPLDDRILLASYRGAL